MALKPNIPNILILFLFSGALLVLPVRGAAAEADNGGTGVWRCGEDGPAKEMGDDACENGWYCPWCHGYIPPGPGARAPEHGCSPCDPHYIPFAGEERFSRNQAILIVEGLLRKSDIPDLMPASIKEMENVYEARIVDTDGFHADTLQVHKVNGWVRSFMLP